MSISWKVLLRRRGISSLTQWSLKRNITTYDQLCGSFVVHGVVPPTREEASNFLESKDRDEGKPLEQSKEVAPASDYEDPVSGVLYDAPEISTVIKKKSGVKKPKGK